MVSRSHATIAIVSRSHATIAIVTRSHATIPVAIITRSHASHTKTIHDHSENIHVHVGVRAHCLGVLGVLEAIFLQLLNLHSQFHHHPLFFPHHGLHHVGIIFHLTHPHVVIVVIVGVHCHIAHLVHDWLQFA